MGSHKPVRGGKRRAESTPFALVVMVRVMVRVSVIYHPPPPPSAVGPRRAPPGLRCPPFQQLIDGHPMCEGGGGICHLIRYQFLLKSHLLLENWAIKIHNLFITWAIGVIQTCTWPCIKYTFTATLGDCMNMQNMTSSWWVCVCVRVRVRVCVCVCSFWRTASFCFFWPQENMGRRSIPPPTVGLRPPQSAATRRTPWSSGWWWPTHSGGGLRTRDWQSQVGVRLLRFPLPSRKWKWRRRRRKIRLARLYGGFLLCVPKRGWGGWTSGGQWDLFHVQERWVMLRHTSKAPFKTRCHIWTMMIYRYKQSHTRSSLCVPARVSSIWLMPL